MPPPAPFGFACSGNDVGRKNIMFSLHEVLDEKSAQIRGDRVVATAMDNLRAAFLSLALVALDHAVDEEHFAREVTVVGACFDAGGHQVFSVESVRPYSGNDDFGFSRDTSEGVRIRAVCHKPRH